LDGLKRTKNLQQQGVRRGKKKGTLNKQTNEVSGISTHCTCFASLW